MNNVTPRYNDLIRDAKGWLEYASLLGLSFLPSASSDALEAEKIPEVCGACPFCKERLGVFRAWGGVSPRLVFVLAAPAPFDGDGEYSPFTGEAGGQIGKIIKAAAAEAGLGDEDIALTFARRCLLPPGQRPASHLLEKAFKCCAPLLREEVEALAPSVVVAMGAEACSALTGRSDIEASRGELLHLEGTAGSPTLVQATYGLSELLGDNKLRRPVWDDILLAIKALKV